MTPMIKFAITLVVSFALGIFAWTKIIGGLQVIKTDKKRIFSILLWLVVLAAVAYCIVTFFDSRWGLIFGYGASLMTILGLGRIE